MKNIIITMILLLGSSFTRAAGTYFDLDEELVVARNLIVERRFELAIDRLEDVVASDAGNADAWNLLGYASRKFGDLEKSAKAYTAALNIDPGHKDALEYQGELFLMLGDKIAAEGNLDTLKLLCPHGCEQYQELKAAISAHR